MLYCKPLIPLLLSSLLWCWYCHLDGDLFGNCGDWRSPILALI